MPDKNNTQDTFDSFERLARYRYPARGSNGVVGIDAHWQCGTADVVPHAEYVPHRRRG